jgi:multidrug resistance efflux pump
MAERRSGRLRALSAWLIVILLIAGAVVGVPALVRQRREPPAALALGDAVLVGESVPVGPADATASAVVSVVTVRAGEAVQTGQRLATVRFPEVLRGNRTIPAVTRAVTAPKDGVVVAVDRKPGSVVRPGEPVVSLYFPDELAFQTSVPVEQLADLRVGMTATIEGPGLTTPIEVIVGRVVPELDGIQDTEHVVLALLPRTGADVRRLVPGLPFSATVDLTSAPSAAPLVADVAE